MALINLSLDTKSRQAVLTIDGIMIPGASFTMDRWVDSDGQEQLSFSYTVTTDNDQGLQETRLFRLQSDASDSLVSEIVIDQKQVVEDLTAYLGKRSNN